ncbi:MAG: hypothetical protein M1133_08665 [Armatimonadetes bacterium]|nr:hypothetical protein [Armatimonadota bacterium]
MDIVSEICVDQQPSGLSAVYLVETRSPEEAAEIGKLFADLQSHIQVRQLCKGKLVSYAVQADDSHSGVLDEIEDILKRNYAFVVTQRSFDDLICRIVEELSRDTGSRLLSIPHCNICGKREPFPNMVVKLTDEEGSVLISRSYCARCTAEAAAPNNKEFVRSLLAADERDFGRLAHAELVRRPSRKQPIRFKIKDSI